MANSINSERLFFCGFSMLPTFGCLLCSSRPVRLACKVQAFAKVVKFHLRDFFDAMEFFLDLLDRLGSASSTLSDSQKRSIT